MLPVAAITQIAVPMSENTSEIFFGIYMVLFWVAVIAWFVYRRRRGKSVPVPVVAAYGWYKLEPMLLWLSYLWTGKRVARFLKTANDLRMRKKGVDGFLPRRPGS
jgi:hypothetical protein